MNREEKISKLKEDRAKIYADQNAFLDSAAAEKRTDEKGNLNAEAQEVFTKMDNDYNALSKAIELEQRMLTKELEVTSTATVIKPTFNGTTGIEEKRTAAFATYLNTGDSTEYRALTDIGAGTGSALIPPTQFVNTILTELKDALFMEQICNVINLTSSDNISYPVQSADIADPDDATEITVGDEDESLAFTLKVLAPAYVAKRVVVSEKMLGMSAMNIEPFIINQIVRKFSESIEKATMTGSGATLGIFTANADGITTARDVVVSGTNSTTAINIDALYAAQDAVKTGYRAKGSWVFSTQVMTAIRKMKDGNGQYIFQPNITLGAPNTLLGRPVYISDYAPSTFTTGLYLAVYGDFSQYYIAKNTNLRIKRLIEKYSDRDCIGFDAKMDVAGKAMFANAFSRIKLA